MASNFNLDIGSVIGCFQVILNPATDSSTRKKADLYLVEAQKNPIQFLPTLMQIVQKNPNDQIKFQALLLFSNVIKRSWTSRRLKQVHSAYQSLKKNIRTKILLDLYQAPKLFLYTYFDIVKFIAKIDFPHNYPQFSQLVIKLTQQISIDENNVLKFKELKQIFCQLASRKGSTSKKLYQEFLTPVLQKLCIASSYFDNQMHIGVQKNYISSILAKLSKYSDQIILSILRMAPFQLLDNEQTLLIVKQQHTKLDHLWSLHQGCVNSKLKICLQKNIKSLVYDLSSLQQTNPFIITVFINDYFKSISQIVANPWNLAKNTTLKYSLLALRKFIRQFSFYSEESLFLNSIGPKTKSKNYLDLRKICHQAYVESLNAQTIQGLLNHLIANLMCKYCKSQNFSFDVQQNMLIDRNQQKQLPIQNCFILLIEAILQKFPDQTHSLIKDMVIASFKNNFEGIDPNILNNIFGVLALLPRTCKKNTLNSLNQIPIIQILTFVYQNPSFKNKIPTLVSGWFDYFNNDQLFSLIGVLLQFIQNQSEISLILHCCQSLDKIITTKKYLLNAQVIEKVFPIAANVFRKTQNPQILWPMVNLISNLIIQFEFDSQIILQSLKQETFQILISSDSAILIEALSQMFKNILCVIPRNKPAQAVYQLVCHFLNNHLSKLNSSNTQKVLNLWYIVVRQYSLIQNCNLQLITLYKEYYKNCLFNKIPTLIYILEEYMLLGFVQTDITEFSRLIYQFYRQANQLDKPEQEQLKISALSFQITLITKYTLKQVNNEQMLKQILTDFYCVNDQKVSGTIHNSLLSIINRFLILHKEQFFSYLNSSNVDLNGFYQVYFANMQYLTSESAKKINCLAVLSLLPFLPNQMLIDKLHYILMTIIPSVQNYISTLQYNPISNTNFTGKILNSPTHRFASNYLSQRKQQIRKKGMFEQVNLHQLYKLEIQNVCSRLNINVNSIAQNFPQNNWSQRFLNLLV